MVSVSPAELCVSHNDEGTILTEYTTANWGPIVLFTQAVGQTTVMQQNHPYINFTPNY